MKFLKIVYKILFSVAFVMLIHKICVKAQLHDFYSGFIEGFFIVFTYLTLVEIENGR